MLEIATKQCENAGMMLVNQMWLQQLFFVKICELYGLLIFFQKDENACFSFVFEEKHVKSATKCQKSMNFVAVLDSSDQFFPFISKKIASSQHLSWNYFWSPQ